jgi:hypothetical protein
MKTILLAAAIAAISIATAQAQTYRSYGNGFGGATTYGPNGSSARTYADGFGGTTTYVQPGFSRRGW